ncbi:hypothetical protein SAMN05428642_103269 [Flaviramulus basaltis]|uniref:Uncharacterized protein n=1 Tax=Flaviramulus basaltis TaxID=369401 RepID=A0A1K2IMJ3_9FLAO|nr:hypothetical protein SAMN05428642_103269 [Flaviramulus basaltis]
MKTNSATSNSLLYSLLDNYIYYVVVKKSYKKLLKRNSNKNRSVSQSHLIRT